MRILALAALLLVGCAEVDTWTKVGEPASPFTLEDLNPLSPTCGEMRTMPVDGKVVVLYFGNYG